MSFCSFSKGEIYRNHFEPGRFLKQLIHKVSLINIQSLKLFLTNHNLSICSKGKYVCKECGHELFRSEAKYEHQTPWPAFTKTILPDSVAKFEERKGALKVNKCFIPIIKFCIFVLFSMRAI